MIRCPLVQLDVHAGVSWEIERKIEVANQEAENLHPESSARVLVFFDEVNTNEHLGLFSEITCDRRCQGVSIHPGVWVACACNPIRLKSAESLENEGKGSSAFPLSTLAAIVGPQQGVQQRNMVKLVYHVTSIPQTMQNYLWNFGALSTSDERSAYVADD